HHPARARSLERGLLLWLGGAPAARSPRSNQWLCRPEHHRRLRDGARAAQPRLELDLCRPTAGSGPPASDLLELHRPAQPLGAGHDADHAVQLSAVQAGPAAGAATGLSLLDDVLAFPAAAHHLPLSTSVLSLLRPADLHR